QILTWTHMADNTRQRTRLQNEVAGIIERIKKKHRDAVEIRDKRNHHWSNIQEIEAAILAGQRTMFSPQVDRNDQFKALEDLEVNMKENHDEAYDCQDQLDKIYTKVVKLIEKQFELELELNRVGNA
ncbi:hypothetical protein FBEOM_13861, partial [Fusarium beomiforme]